MLPHRGDARMVRTLAVPESLKYLAVFGHLDDAADIDVRVHPLVGWKRLAIRRRKPGRRSARSNAGERIPVKATQKFPSEARLMLSGRPGRFGMTTWWVPSLGPSNQYRLRVQPQVSANKKDLPSLAMDIPLGNTKPRRIV